MAPASLSPCAWSQHLQAKRLFYLHLIGLAILARFLLPRCRGFYLAPHDSNIDFELVEDVLRYFTRNPNAADTVEGLARWRLVDEVIHSNLKQVASAVAWLVSQGMLVEESTSPQTKVVRLNEQQLGQIERFLLQVSSKARKRPARKKTQGSER